MLRIIRRAILLTAMVCAGPALAAWPERPVVIVVPYSAGGIADLLARVTADRLQASFKQAFVIENEPGGGGVIAAQRVARAQPDGYTLISCPSFLITMAPITHKVDFDPLKDFKPISIFAASPFVITATGAFPADTLTDFIAAVKKQPGLRTFGSAGPGSLTHVASAVFLKSAGLDMIHVPYKGVAPAFSDLLAGHIDMLAATPVELKPYLGSRKAKPLAVTGSGRSKYLPDVPAIIETLASPPVLTTNGLLAPGRTPDGIVAAIASAITAAEKSADFRERLAAIGVEPVINTPEEFAVVMAADARRWRDIFDELGLKIQ